MSYIRDRAEFNTTLLLPQVSTNQFVPFATLSFQFYLIESMKNKKSNNTASAVKIVVEVMKVTSFQKSRFYMDGRLLDSYISRGIIESQSNKISRVGRDP